MKNLFKVLSQIRKTMSKVISALFLFLFICIGVLALPLVSWYLIFSKHKSDYRYQVKTGYTRFQKQLWGTEDYKIITAPFTLTYMIFGLTFGALLALLGNRYWFLVWLKFDKLFNAIFDGVHNETISSRLGKSIHHNHEPVFFRDVKYDKIVAWALHQLDRDHCANSIEWHKGVGKGG